jgi:hypothetical protein
MAKAEPLQPFLKRRITVVQLVSVQYTALRGSTSFMKDRRKSL